MPAGGLVNIVLSSFSLTFVGRVLALSVLLTVGSCSVPVAPPSDGNDNGGNGDPTPGTEQDVPGVWNPAFDASGFGAFSSVWGSGPDDVFMVGGTLDQGQVARFDGQTWSAMEVPQVSFLSWVFGFAPERVFAVGVGGTLIEYDGQAWGIRESGTEADLWSIWGATPDAMWVVGGDGTQPVVLGFDADAPDASAFTPFSLPSAAASTTALFNVWGIGSKTFAVGTDGLILEFDAQNVRWIESPTGPAANEDFFALWGTSEDHVVAVGGLTGGRLAVYDGRRWTTEWVSVSGAISAVHMLAPDQAIIGGESGFVADFDPVANTLRLESAETPLTISALWSDGAGRVYGAGGQFVEPFSGVALVRTEGTPDDGEEPPPTGLSLDIGITNNGIYDDIEDGNIVRLQIDDTDQVSMLITLRTEGFAANAELIVSGGATLADGGAVIAADTDRGIAAFTEIETGLNELRDFEFVLESATYEEIENTEAILTVSVTDLADSTLTASITRLVFLAPPRTR